MRRLIRKLKNPMGKNWERISHDAVVQPLVNIYLVNKVRYKNKS